MPNKPETIRRKTAAFATVLCLVAASVALTGPALAAPAAPGPDRAAPTSPRAAWDGSMTDLVDLLRDSIARTWGAIGETVDPNGDEATSPAIPQEPNSITRGGGPASARFTR